MELPLALPEIMLGINQTILLALAMIIICAMIGTRDLGQEVFIALSKAEAGRGIVAGLAAVQALNVVRVVSLFYLGQWDTSAFEWAHLYLWQALIMLDVLPVPDADGDEPLAGVMGWMLEHVGEDLSVEQLARRARTSPRTFARRFRAVTGTTPLQWLLRQAGTFQQLVLAAERCPVAAIHPGTPLNPREKDLPKWVKRAKPFN